MSSTGSVTCLAHQPDHDEEDHPDERRRRRAAEQEVDGRPRQALTLTRRPSAPIAVRSATRAVASLSSDSPSRIVTIRRGSPIRRAIAVAATASGGATTAPRANAAAKGPAAATRSTSADADRGEEHQPDRQQQMAARFALEVDQRGRIAAA